MDEAFRHLPQKKSGKRIFFLKKNLPSFLTHPLQATTKSHCVHSCVASSARLRRRRRRRRQDGGRRNFISRKKRPQFAKYETKNMSKQKTSKCELKLHFLEIVLSNPIYRRSIHAVRPPPRPPSLLSTTQSYASSLRCRPRTKEPDTAQAKEGDLKA